MLYWHQEKMDALNEQINKGIRILKQGGVIAFPTDTVYGLGADAFNLKAVERIYQLKKRPTHLPLPLLIGDVEQLAVLAVKPLPEIALFLARRFWPGGLTLVVPKAANLPGYLGNTNIAVRVPAHPICLALIQAINNPMIGTSANISGKPSVVTAGEVKQQLGNEVDLIIDGGRCPGGGESTVVDVAGGGVVILRHGIVSQDELDRALEELSSLHSHPTAPFKREVNSPSSFADSSLRSELRLRTGSSLSRRGRGTLNSPPSPGGRELEGGGK
jgi:L-threonylcarbamoyladenylate synthase